MNMNKGSKGMFGNYVPRYFCSKKPGYFAFRCLVMPHHRIFRSPKYLEIMYFKSRTSPICFQNIQYSGIDFGVEETALFAICALSVAGKRCFQDVGV